MRGSKTHFFEFSRLGDVVLEEYVGILPGERHPPGCKIQIQPEVDAAIEREGLPAGGFAAALLNSSE